MKVAIIIPTVAGREQVFDQVLDAYAETRPTGWEFDLIVPEGHATVGEAWNAGSEDADADYVFYTIDDAEPHPGWAQVATRTVDAGYIPAPRLEHADGTLESCGSMGFGVLLPDCPDRTPCRSCGVFFLKPEWVTEVGAFLPTHYAVDDDYAWRCSLNDIRILYRSDFRFTHYHEQRGTLGTRRDAQLHGQMMVNHAATLTLPERLVPA